MAFASPARLPDRAGSAELPGSISPRAGPRRARQPVVAAQAYAGAASVPLASYPFPALRPSVPLWLADSVREVAQNIEQAPLLQLVLPGQQPPQRHTVPPAVVHTPQLWRGIAEHLSRSDPDSMLLVHPLVEPEAAEEPSLQAAKARMERLGAQPSALTGIAVRRDAGSLGEHQWRLEACAKLLEAGIAQPELAGRVGDCCDGQSSHEELRPHGPEAAATAASSSSNVVSFIRSREGRDTAAGAAAAAAAAQQARGSGAEGQVSYYGVVVQSKRRDGAEGCYILKTVRVSSVHDECTCLHYTLVRVCRGEPIASQLMASWLA